MTPTWPPNPPLGGTPGPTGLLGEPPIATTPPPAPAPAPAPAKRTVKRRAKKAAKRPVKKAVKRATTVKRAAKKAAKRAVKKAVKRSTMGCGRRDRDPRLVDEFDGAGTSAPRAADLDDRPSRDRVVGVLRT